MAGVLDPERLYRFTFPCYLNVVFWDHSAVLGHEADCYLRGLFPRGSITRISSCNSEWIRTMLVAARCLPVCSRFSPARVRPNKPRYEVFVETSTLLSTIITAMEHSDDFEECPWTCLELSRIVCYCFPGESKLSSCI